MIFIGVLGLGLYWMIKKNPYKTKNILSNASSIIKNLPVNNSSLSLLSPILDLTSKTQSPFTNYEPGYNGTGLSGQNPNPNPNPSQTQQPPIKIFKRSVSETKKKYVASEQNWLCGMCKTKLTHTFEVDHKLSLEKGGSNETSNLVALCRNCHGNKTAMDNM